MVVVVLAVVSLVALWLGSHAASLASAEGAPPSHAGLPWVVVGEGDTLWKIAEAVAPGDDPGPVVGEIIRLNGLDDSLIRAGTRLYLPDGEAP